MWAIMESLKLHQNMEILAYSGSMFKENLSLPNILNYDFYYFFFGLNYKHLNLVSYKFGYIKFIFS